MKISVITNEKTWHTEQLKAESEKKNISLNFFDIIDLNSNDEIKNLGDVILWRSASVNNSFGRNTWMNIMKKKLVINHGILKYPFVAHKFFQQKLIKKFINYNTIETFNFKSIENVFLAIDQGKLTFPFIQKPNLGSRGIGVSLIKARADLLSQKINYEDYIYQNFIENDGDYRVLIVGGRPLGVIKRIAQGGGFLNNISQGGVAVEILDTKIVEKVTNIAVEVASLFDLALCGIDIIYDNKNNKFHFLELNTVPQWKGFQSATKINVANEILDFCVSIDEREKRSAVALVNDYYNNSARLLPTNKRFHYCSRLFIWTGKKEYKKELDKMEGSYIGLDHQETRKIIEDILNNSKKYNKEVYNNRDGRLKYIKKYPKLGIFHEILFKNLMANLIYGKDYRDIVSELLDINEVVQLYKDLLKDQQAIIHLSTFATTFIYLVQSFIPDEKVLFDPGDILKIIENDKQESVVNRIYLITYCIIGRSSFYSDNIDENTDVYRKMLIYAEGMIKERYFEISLDCKFEFLVCCRMMKYESILFDIIKQESEKSFSKIGNYLVDTYNSHGSYKGGKGIFTSEHRNVLFLMAFSEKI